MIDDEFVFNFLNFDGIFLSLSHNSSNPPTPLPSCVDTSICNYTYILLRKGNSVCLPIYIYQYLVSSFGARRKIRIYVPCYIPQSMHRFIQHARLLNTDQVL